MSTRTRSRGVVAHSRRIGLGGLALVLLLSGLVVGVTAPTPASAAGLFTVNSTLDEPDTSPDDGVCLTSVGSCTLRAAIEAANALAGADTISFAVAGTAPIVITPASALPAITSQVTVNGYSQPGAAANNLTVGTNAVYGIELVGANTPGVAGLDLQAGADLSVIRGISVRDFDIGIRAQGAANVVIAGNAVNNRNEGIQVVGSSSVQIGGFLIADRNHVFGGGNHGIQLRSSTGTSIYGNLLGTDRSALVRTTLNYGIHVTDGTTFTTIGGGGNGRNVVSGNSVSGILVQALPGDSGDIHATAIRGNYIGVDGTGNAALGNGKFGIEVQGVGHLAEGTYIGDGTPTGRNIISGNALDGISIWDSGAQGGLILGNYIGVGANGVTALGNDLALGTDLATVPGGGIAVRNFASGFTIGGSPGNDNLIANNLRGVVIYSGTGNDLVGNRIRDNVGLGIELGGIGANDPGDADTGANNGQNYPTITPWLDGPNLRVEYSIDSSVGSSAYPIQIEFFEADNAVSGEGAVFLGRFAANSPDELLSADLGSAVALGVAAGDPIVAVARDSNGNSSMFSPAVSAATPLTVTSGGDGSDTAPGDGVCTGPDGCTFRAAIQESNAHTGTDVISFAIPGSGVQVIAPSGSAYPAITERVVIDAYRQNGASRNTAPFAYNASNAILLSGALVGGATGLDIASGAPGTVVRGLQISSFAVGVKVAGSGSSINGNRISSNTVGVLLDGATGVHIGGADSEPRNLISGNSGTGVLVRNSNANFIQGNLIGTTAAGTSGFGNAVGVGLEQGSSFNLIGGTAFGQRNVISGNSSTGIDLQASISDSANLSQNSIIGNYIGTDVSGNVALGNAGFGIWLAGGGTNFTQFTTIGGETPQARNVIAGNGIDGIEIRQNVNTTDIYGNYIGLGADGTTVLGNGVLGTNSMGISVSDLSPANTITNTVIGDIGPPSGFGNVIVGSDIGVGVSGSAATVRVRGNSIYGNALYGIRLFGVTTNDLDDADTGPNNRQNHPTFLVNVGTGRVMASVNVDSTVANTQYPVQVELYETDGTSDQGKRYLATGSVLAPGTSPIDFGDADALLVAEGDDLVMTATDANGNTSQFSPTVTVPITPNTATFTNLTPGADFNTAANWNTGQIPGPTDTAIIPVGADMIVDQAVTVGRLVVQGTLTTVVTGTPFTLAIAGLSTPSIVTSSGQFNVGGAELSLGGDLTVNGYFQSDAGTKVTSTANLTIGGSGDFILGGELRHVGPGTSTSIADPLRVILFDSATVEATSGTSIDVHTMNWQDNGAHYLANPGSWLNFSHDLLLAPTSVMETRIIGSSITGANYGAFEVSGMLGRAGQFKATLVNYTPDEFDEYFAVYCGDCFDGAWNSTSARPLELHYSTTPPMNRIILRTVPNKVLPDGPGLQGLGASVDVDGDWAIVGQTNGLSDNPFNRAVVYHYNATTDTWDQIQTIQGQAGFVFGEDVAIDGNWIAITSRGPGTADDTTVVYNRLADGPFNNFVGSRPGAGSVAIDHGMMVIGNPEGALKNAMVYLLDSFGINTQQILWPHGNGAPQVVNSYGSDVAIWFDPGTGNGTIAVGAPEPGATPGRVYLFTRGANWNADPVEILSEIDSGLGPDSIDQYGWSVAVAPNTLAVGHRLLDAPLQDQGGVWMYNGAPGSYTGTGQLVRPATPDVSDTFGTSVALEGTRLIVGAPSAQKFNHPIRDGAVYVFEKSANIWNEIDIRRAPDGESFDLYGSAVATSGSVILVGASGDANDNGLDAGAFYSYGTTPAPPVVSPSLAFDMQVATGSPSTVEVAPSGLAVTLFDRTITAARASSSLAAASISEIGVEDTALASISIGSTPLKAIVLGSTPLKAIPLSAIDITLDNGGGWTSLLAGTDLETRVFSNLTFGDVLSDPVVESRIAALPLKAIDVGGTPLKAIPLSAIVLGSTPLKAIPLKAIGPNDPNPWCDIIADLLVQSQETCAQALDHLNLMEVTLRGVPLSAIPLKAIPLKAIDLEQSPLKAIPLKAIDLAQSPLKAIPLKAIPLSAINVDGAPLSAIPLKAIPLKAIPLKAIPLSAIDINGTPLSAIPLSAITVDGVPLKAITVDGITLDGTPLKAIPLKAIPLKAIDLGASPLKAIPLKAIPLKAIPLKAIDLYASPLKAIPLSAIDIQGTPLSAIPLKAIPLSAIPLSAIPLKAIPLSAIPLKAIPLSAITIGTTPLKAIPLKAIDVLNSPLKAIPLKAITTLGITVNCAVVDCDLGSLGDAYARGAVDGAITLEQLQGALAGISLGELAKYFVGFGATDLTQAIGNTLLTLADLTSLDDITLGDLPSDLPALAGVLLGSLGDALNSATIGDLIGAATNPNTGLPYTVLDLRNDISPTVTVGNLTDTVGLTIGDLIDSSAGPVVLQDLGSLLGYIPLDVLQTLVGPSLVTQLEQLGLTLGDLTTEQFGQMTLLDIVASIGNTTLGNLLTELGNAGLLDGFTLGDLLLAMLDPSSLAQSDVQFKRVNVGTLPSGTVGATNFAAKFTLTAGTDRNVEVTIDVPAAAAFVPGTATINGLAAEPTVAGSTLTWTVQASPGIANDIRFGVLPTLRLGATSLSGTASVVGTDVIVDATATVTVREGIEPNDFDLGTGGIRQTTPAVEDTVYLTYIADSSDIDVFELNLAENDQLVAQLSNLDADLDVYLWRRVDSAVASGALARTSGQTPLFSVTDPDAAAGTAEPLADFPRLDQLDPTLQLVATSNATGTGNESIRTDRLPAGSYFVEVVGANGATTTQPAALQLKVLEADVRPACQAIPSLPTRVNVPALPTIPATANTLILVNSSRMEQLYGPTGRATVTSSLNALTSYLATDGAALNVVPVVVPVDAYLSVRTAYDHWDTAAGSCDPDAANAIVAAINHDIIDPNREQFDHIVMIGGDQVIPMARLDDNTGVANEYDFRHEFDGDLTGRAGRNAATASFWDSKVLSDEPYGEASARSLGDRFLYVSDAALGRLVETPAEIASALDTFRRFHGTLAIDTAAVLGYDFLADGSAKVADALTAGGVATVDRDLADGFDASGAAWDRLDVETKINALQGNTLVSLNAHFDHYRALPANGDKVPGFSDNLIATDVAPAASLLQSLVFSMGCHSGFSASDILIGATNADWAQELGKDGSLFVGNTGFGYGDTKTVAYTERLMELFAQQVTSPLDLPSDAGAASSTVGQALTWAKNAYMAQIQTLSVYDEKALQESTFYGLPFYRVGLPTDPLPATPTRRAVPDATGTPSTRTVVDASNQPRATDAGLYFANTDSGDDQTIVAPGRPIQPKAVRDISVVSPTDPTVLDQRAVGAIVLSMNSTYQSLPNPVIATPEFDQTGAKQEAAVGDVAFPSKPLTIATTTGPAGERQDLVIATGQYQSDTQTQRLDDNIDVVVYYADATNPDRTAPTVGTVDSTVVNGRLAISLSVTDTGTGTGVDRVYVLVAQNPGSAGSTWTGVDLVKTVGTDRWSGSLTLAPTTTSVEFLVQAKDDAGNVGVASNKATNFADDLQPALAPPVAPASALTVTVPPTPPTGSFTAPVTVQVNSTSPVTVTVEGAPPSTLPSGPTSFVITGDGVRAWSVSSLAGYTKSGTVTIDTTAPSVSVDRAPGLVPSPTAITLSGADAGSGITHILYSLSGAQIGSNDVAGASTQILLTAEGSTTITAEAFDAAGNSSGAKTFTFEVNGTPPVVTASLSSQPNDAGWWSDPVMVTWSVDDPAANVPRPTSVYAQGSNIRITSGPSCDPVGNCATGSVTLKVDYTDPDFQLSTDRPGNAFDWNNTPVRVLSTCALDVSGFACPAPIAVNTDGAGQTVAVSVEDAAGNVASLTSRVINIDQVAPTLNWTAPANGAIVNTFVKPTCTALDDRSGINGTCSVDVDEPVLVTAPNSTLLAFNEYKAKASVTDRAGNTATLTSTWRVKAETNPPVVTVTETPPANPAGWWKSDVTFSFVCTDASPGVAVCPTSVTKSLEGAGQTFTVTASDFSGNDNVMSLTANIDKTPPVVTATAPATVGLLDTVTLTCAATDALSGIDNAASRCTDRTFPANQLTAGPNVFTFSATDLAGNVTTVTKTVTLVVPTNPAPTVRADMGVTGLNEIGFQSNVVILTGTFADPNGPGPYTASVRWTATGPFTPLILANDGSFVAAWIYGSAGVRTATVRICDAQGACGTDDVVIRSGVTNKVTPVRECVVDRGAAVNPRYQARWGYTNPATFAIAVPSIPLFENTFTSSPFLRGQPQIFLPGSQRAVFTTTFSSGTVAWKLNGVTASATTTSTRC